MCRFCTILEAGLKQRWEVRSTYAEDNFNEYLEENWWDKESYFLLGGYLIDGEMRVSLEYFNKLENKHTNDEIIIHPFTESTVFKYCPCCGKNFGE